MRATVWPVATPENQLRLRRLIGLAMVLLGLALIPSMISAANAHKYGEGPSSGRADCGTWARPSELAQYRPVSMSAGCAQAIGDSSRKMLTTAAFSLVLLTAGACLLIVGRIRPVVWVAALVGLVLVLWGASQPGGLGNSITTFFFVVLAALVAIVLLRIVSKARRMSASEDGDAGSVAP
jgi:hypothetical protein